MARPSAQTSGARIDWELLPSLRNMLLARMQRSTPAWSDTVVSDFGPLPYQSAAFEEVVPGLAVREVSEPEIFEIFFG